MTIWQTNFISFSHSVMFCFWPLETNIRHGGFYKMHAPDLKHCPYETGICLKYLLVFSISHWLRRARCDNNQNQVLITKRRKMCEILSQIGKNTGEFWLPKETMRGEIKSESERKVNNLKHWLSFILINSFNLLLARFSLPPRWPSFLSGIIKVSSNLI